MLLSPAYTFRLVVLVGLVAITAGCDGLARVDEDETAGNEYSIVDVSFPTVVVAGTSAGVPVDVVAKLYLPADSSEKLPAAVILPTSAGIQSFREHYYAREVAASGYVALIVDSFESRGVISAIENQNAITSYQLEADAFGALRFLQQHPRVKPDAVAVMGGSKGGTAALNSVFLIREEWRKTSSRFAAHVAISPNCGVQQRSTETTGAPLLVLLAENDDFADPGPCRDYAAALSTQSEANVLIHEVRGAAHGWERQEAVEWIERAENFSGCRGVMEDDGRISVDGVPAPLSSGEYLAWARAECVTRGAHSGGGTTEMRNAVTATILAFLQGHTG